MTINEMTIIEAAKYYASKGIITFPVHPHTADVKSPGKQPKHKEWQKLEKPFTEEEINEQFAGDCNIGLLCGRKSDLTVIDIDLLIKGIWDNILSGTDTSAWISQEHCTDKWHYLFKFSKGLKAGQYQALGFDILSDDIKKDTKGIEYIAGDNCIGAPSIHPDKNKYRITGNIEERPEIPQTVKQGIINTLRLYEGIKKYTLPKCRPAFRGLWSALFEDKKHELYRHTEIFIGAENRSRLINFITELKANGADKQHLILACMLIFGDRFNREKSTIELSGIDKTKTATDKTISEDPYLSRFHIHKETKRERGEEEEEEKVNVLFDALGNLIIEKYPMFVMQDTEEFFLYDYGVYTNRGSKLKLSRIIRDEFKTAFIELWKELYPDKEIKEEEVPGADTKYIKEVVEYIRAYSNADREDIDSQQDRYINFKNGLFDLQEWKLIEHTPEIKTIAQLPVKYDPEARCPKIEAYFKSCWLPPESIEVLTEFAGYCLTTDVKLQKAVMLYGKGANGKSVFINLLKTVLGRDFVSGESLHKLEIDKFRVANLHGKRLNAFPDLKDTPLQTNEVFNTLTGNDLMLIGERKYQHSFNFKPTVKLLFSANKIPFAYSDNYAYYRRWILIEFPRTFEKHEIDENLLEKLTTETEMSGFINLILAGLKRLFKNRKFSYDLGVEEIEKQYLLHSDNVQVFEETCLRDCSGNETPTEKNLVYKFYQTWCKVNNLIPVKQKTFTKKLDKIGRKVHNTTRYVIGDKREWFSCYFNTVVDFKQEPEPEPHAQAHTEEEPSKFF